MDTRTNEQEIVQAKSIISAKKEIYRNAVQDFCEAAECGATVKECQEKLRQVHELGNQYFNYIEEFVVNSDLLGAHKNDWWVTGFAEDCAEHLKTLMHHYNLLYGCSEKKGYTYPATVKPGTTSYANIQRMVVEYLPPEISEQLHQQFKAANLPTYGFEYPVSISSKGQPKWQLIVGLVVGSVLLVAVIIMSLIIPNPSTWQVFVFRGTFALSISAIAAIVPGFLNVQTRYKGKRFVFAIWAGGAIAIFVIIWMINPPALIVAAQ